MTETRLLYVLRHAKSSWDDPGAPDHDRPLAPRGRKALKVLAAYVHDSEIHPELVLCSSARRTRETLEGISLGGEQLIEPELYGASCEQLIERLRRVPDATASVMVIGHNPTLQMLVLKLLDARRALAAESSAEMFAEIQRKFPTGALATLVLGSGWSELRVGGAELAGYVRPKALMYH
jgi:phosphohistidine phosphatase